jgi:hypothetical protein
VQEVQEKFKAKPTALWMEIMVYTQNALRSKESVSAAM